MSTSISNILRDYSLLLMELHRIIAENGEGDEAEVVRERLDEVWGQLSTEQVELTQGLSADLYLLNPAEHIFQNADEQQQKQIEELFSRQFLLPWHDWRKDLYQLKNFIRRDQLLYTLGRGWERLGFVAVARAFYLEAIKINPEHEKLRIMKLQNAFALGLRREVIMDGEKLLIGDLEQHRRAWVIEMVLASNMHVQLLSLDRVRALVDELEAIGRQEICELPQRTSVLAFVANQRGLIDDRARACQIFDELLSQSGDDPELLTAAAVNLVHMDRHSEADALFERAIARGATGVWPYLYRIPRLLTEQKYELAQDYCQIARRLTQELRHLAFIEFWHAISEGECGAPREKVLEHLNLAQSLLPNHPSIHASVERYRIDPSFHYHGANQLDDIQLLEGFEGTIGNAA